MLWTSAIFLESLEEIGDVGRETLGFPVCRFTSDEEVPSVRGIDDGGVGRAAEVEGSLKDSAPLEGAADLEAFSTV